MQLIGMLDSPYVRRVAVSLQLLRIPFEHRVISVFSGFDAFRHINPVVKAPSLVCADGSLLMESSLILDYAEALATEAGSGRSLMPVALPARQRVLRLVSLALAACDKSVQIIYERSLRPPEKQHAPWLERVAGQLTAAYRLLEEELIRQPLAATAETIDQAGLTTAIAWHFTQKTLPEVVPAGHFPALSAFSHQAESLPSFIAAPHGDQACRSCGA
jgi:glutathione S-transferase